MLNRTIQLNIRVTQEEKQRFEQAAKACGLSLSRYVRMRLSGRVPQPTPPLEYQQILARLTELYQRENTPQVQAELLNTLLAIQSTTLPRKES